VAGLFTYADETNEADIEVLTADNATTYRFTNQPSVDKHGDSIERASVTATALPAWTGWRVHRIDWVKGAVRWFVDGKLVATNGFNVPKKPSGIILNLWSDGGVWSGNMSVSGRAEMHVQWVQIAFNTSGNREGPRGKRGGKVKKKKSESFMIRRSSRLWFGQQMGEVHGQGQSSLIKRVGSGKRGCANVCVIDGVAREGYPEMVYQGMAGIMSPYKSLVVLCATLVIWVSAM
jgi:beta-glucanase (GH16 family)